MTCANTNTALPYIDIVNETLEYFVASGLTLDGYQGHDTGDEISSAELLASPQYTDDAAYAILRDAFFPPPLPFSLPLALLRLQLQNLGLDLPDAMATLRAGDQLVNRQRPPASAGRTSSSSSWPSPATSTACSPTPPSSSVISTGSRRPARSRTCRP